MSKITLDRSRLEQWGTCPYQAYLGQLWDAIKANAEGYEVFPWEAERVKNADIDIVNKMKSTALQARNNKYAEIGIMIHDLIDRAFTECQGDQADIAEWFVDKLPHVRPDLQPQVIVHARHVADLIVNYHVNFIGTEIQIAHEVKPGLIITMCYDLLGFGSKTVMHAVDWKTGWKKRSNTEAAESFQASCGCWLIWQQKEYEQVDLIHWWYYETLGGTKAYARFDKRAEHPRQPGLNTEQAIHGRITEAVKYFEANSQESWPLPEKCAWCDFTAYCKKAHANAKEIANDPKAFVDRLVVDTEYCKQMKKIASDWIKAKGAIEGSKVVLAPKPPSNRFTVDFQELPSGPAQTGDDDLDSHF